MYSPQSTFLSIFLVPHCYLSMLNTGVMAMKLLPHKELCISFIFVSSNIDVLKIDTVFNVDRIIVNTEKHHTHDQS